ncbi:hypothetical protein BZG36_05547 [Bifiguratus adelaidae]|uniref:NB-ARC domain-containing protein n=1 Tax=Bifiguratus adelaidae TaxID=1938954 RepID=A0A261XUK0_9FUNG|nr:hypothetical protein BZG36_05547 [Bifiguratus adelaidae]
MSSSSRSSSPNRPKILVLQALGGQVKTQLALEYCRRSKEAKVYRGIFWINASSTAAASRDLEAIAGRLNTPSKKELPDIKSKIAFVKEELESWKEKWLMVFDNCGQPSLFNEINQLMPSDSGQGNIIITSRHKDSERFGETINVKALTEDEGFELLLHSSKKDRTEQNAVDGKKIVGMLVAFSAFPKLYDIQKAAILKYTPNGLWKYHMSDAETETSLSVFTTCELSFKQIGFDAETHKAIEHFITLSAFFEPTKIDEMIFSAYFKDIDNREDWMWIFDNQDEEELWDSEKFQEIVAELTNLSLTGFNCGQTTEGKCSNYTKEAIQLLTCFLESDYINSLRLPRAQKAQRTARQAGDLYELQAEDMKGKTLDECIPTIHDNLKDRVKWIWTKDVDAAYEKEVEAQTSRI